MRDVGGKSWEVCIATLEPVVVGIPVQVRVGERGGRGGPVFSGGTWGGWVRGEDNGPERMRGYCGCVPAPPHRLVLRLSRSSSWRSEVPPGSCDHLDVVRITGCCDAPGKVRVSASEYRWRADVCKASGGACSSSGRTQVGLGRSKRESLWKVGGGAQTQETGWVCPRIDSARSSPLEV